MVYQIFDTGVTVNFIGLEYAYNWGLIYEIP